MHSGQAPVAPLALLVVVLVADTWVFVNARRRQEDRTVVASVGPLKIETPVVRGVLGLVGAVPPDEPPRSIAVTAVGGLAGGHAATNSASEVFNAEARAS
jgi:carbon monoxide dehydrogenase subunit G